MIKRLVILACLLSTPAYANQPEPTYPTTATFTVEGIWPGGIVDFFMGFWKELAQTGVNLRINGMCISACTFFLAYFPEDRICITPRASLGFHQAGTDRGPEPEFSRALYTMLYPAWVRQWIEARGGLEADVGYMFAKDMQGHIKLCEGEYDVVDPQKIIAPEKPSTEPAFFRH